MSRSAVAGQAFALDLPDDWLVLNTQDGERIPAQLQRLLDEGAANDEAFSSHRGALERQIRQVLRNVRQHDVDFSALHTTVIADVLPLVATLTVATQTALVDGAASLVEEYVSRPGYQADVVTLRDSSESVGKAVRVRFSDTVSDPQAGVSIAATVCQWLIPTPKRAAVTVLTFATPVTEPVLIDSYLGLFAAIADSFEYLPAHATGAA